MATDLWAEFRTGPAAPATGAPAQSRQQFPGVIQGRPKPVDPYKDSAEQRAQQDQALQQQSAMRENERLRLAEEAAARQQQEAQLGTESERTAGFLSGRAKDAALRLAGAARKNPDAQNPTLGVELVRGTLGDTAANYLSDSERQQIRAAQIDIIDAGLTLGTGAAYTKEQLEGYREVYFPKLGDDEATIASKREALRSLLVNAQTKAGRAAPDIGEALAALDGLEGLEKQEGEPTRAKKLFDVYGITTENESAIVDYWNRNRGNENLTLADVKEWYQSQGIAPPDDAGLQQGVERARGGDVGFGGFDTESLETAYQQRINERADRFEELGGEAGALELAKSGVTFGLTDEASGVGNVLAQALTGDFDIGQNYREGRDTQREIERRARERTGGLGIAAELVGAGGAVRGAGNVALNAARGLRAGGQAVNRGAIQGRMVRDATIGGAGVGALGGFGYGEGLEGSATNALLGGALGGAIGNVGQRVGNALANRAPSGGNPPSGGQIMQAADDLGIEMLAADVGGVGTRMATGGVSSTFGGIPIAEGAERAIGSAAAARNRIASEMGEASDDAGAGQAVGKGFREFVDSSLQRGAELFERVPIPAEAKVSLNATRNELMKITEGFRSNPELSRLWANYPKLKQTLEALTPADTRPAGQILYTEATDSLRYAEDTARRAKDQASNIIAEKAAAREGYMNARERFAAMDLETTPAQKLSDARKAVQNAEARWLKVRDVTPDEKAISAAEKAIKAAKSKQDVAFIESRQPPMGGELSWQDMKRFRSIVGEIIGQPGIKSDGSDIAALRKLYGAISRDMEATAAATSPRALTEFSRANQFWRGREKRIEDVFAGLLGSKGEKAPEKVFQQINRWASKQGGDFARLARTIRSMPQDEANTVRSTVVQRMGMARPSNQEGAGGEVFSPTEFATQWQGMSQRAKSVLFPDKQHRADLEKLARVMEGMKGATKYQNYSRTALGVNTAGQGALAITNLPVAATLAGLQYGAGKLLASPKFARLIAGAPKANTPQSRKALSARLANLAKAEPALSNEIGLYRSALDRAANDNAVVMQSAAQEQNAEERRQKP